MAGQIIERGERTRLMKAALNAKMKPKRGGRLLRVKKAAAARVAKGKI